MSNSTIFPPCDDGYDNVSDAFDLQNAVGLLQVSGLVENQGFILEYWHEDDCDGFWEPFHLCCGQPILKYPVNQMFVPDIPGRYRVVILTFDDSGEVIAPAEPDDYEDIRINIVKFAPSAGNAQVMEFCCNHTAVETPTTPTDPTDDLVSEPFLAQTGGIALGGIPYEPGAVVIRWPDGTIVLVDDNGDPMMFQSRFGVGVLSGTVDQLADLEPGEVVSTTGYYETNDGGQGEYIVVPAGTGVADGGSFIDVPNSNMQLMLLHGCHIKAEQWGVRKDQESSAQFQAAWYYAADKTRSSRFDGLETMKFTLDKDILTNKTLMLSKSNGVHCSLDCELNGRITAIGGDQFEAQFGGTVVPLTNPRDAGASPADFEPIPVLEVRNRRAKMKIRYIDCNMWASGIRFYGCNNTTVGDNPTVWAHRTYGVMVANFANNELKLNEFTVKQWGLGDSSDYDGRAHPNGTFNMANYTGDTLVCCQKDMMIQGGEYGWSRSAGLFLGAGPIAMGETAYWDGMEASGVMVSAGTGDVHCNHVHWMQGYGGAAGVIPRWDNIEVGGPIGVEVWNNTNEMFLNSCDYDVCTVQLYGQSVVMEGVSWTHDDNSNVWPQFDPVTGDLINGTTTLAAIINPWLRIYADGTNNIRLPLITDTINTTIGVYDLDGNAYGGDYTCWNYDNRPNTGPYVGPVQFKAWLVANANTCNILGLDMMDCRVGLGNGVPATTDIAAGDQLYVVEDGVYGGVALTSGTIITAQINNPGFTDLSNWYVPFGYFDIVNANQNYEPEVRSQRIKTLHGREGSAPWHTVFKPGGSIVEQWDVGCDSIQTRYDGTSWDVVQEGGVFGLNVNFSTGIATIPQQPAELTLNNQIVTKKNIVTALNGPPSPANQGPLAVNELTGDLWYKNSVGNWIILT